MHFKKEKSNYIQPIHRDENVFDECLHHPRAFGGISSGNIPSDNMNSHAIENSILNSSEAMWLMTGVCNIQIYDCHSTLHYP